MARIVYGVAGEGSGHASRASEVLDHLVARGHEVKVATYDRGWEMLSPRFDCREIEGLSIGTDGNEVDLVRTFTENLTKVPSGVRSLRGVKSELFEHFRPDLAITDFEPLVAHLARHFDLPLVTIDNQHLIRYVECPCPPSMRKDALVTRNIVRALVPKPDVSLVTTFFFGSISNRRTFLFPPILRRAVREQRPERGEHVLAYFTKGFDRALELFRRVPEQPFVVYGYDRDHAEDNLVFAKRSSERFLRDLASCKAVVATAGSSLIGEVLQLGKAMLALPMQGQFEQELNAALLERAGYGANGRDLTLETLSEFLRRVPEHEVNLASYPRGDDRALFDKLDQLLADECALAHDFHARRDELSST